MRQSGVLIRCMSAALLPLLLAGCGEPPAAQAPAAGAPEVDVAAPLKRAITEWDEYTGRFEAVQRVELRARVSGYITGKNFRDGQIVEKGTVLFEIDPRIFEQRLARVEAQHALADRDVKRAQGLVRSGAIPEEEFDRRRQELRVAETALSEARLDLEFTKVRAPIDGRVSDGFVDVGNLVRENDTVLTRMVSVNPVHFEFEASQTELLKYLRLNQSGERPDSRGTPNPIFIRLQDEEQFGHVGRMDFVDNVVDPATGTIRGRALVPNPDGIIYPGLFGRARLAGRQGYEAILLPERVLNTDQNRKFVYVLDEQNQAGRAYVTLGPLLDNGFVVVRSGLTGDERVVVSGTQRIRAPQQPVTPVAVELAWQDLPDMPAAEQIPSLDEIAGVPPVPAGTPATAADPESEGEAEAPEPIPADTP